MQWTSAPNIGEAPLPQRARSYWKTRFSAFREGLEKLPRGGARAASAMVRGRLRRRDRRLVRARLARSNGRRSCALPRRCALLGVRCWRGKGGPGARLVRACGGCSAALWSGRARPGSRSRGSSGRQSYRLRRDGRYGRASRRTRHGASAAEARRIRRFRRRSGSRSTRTSSRPGSRRAPRSSSAPGSRRRRRWRFPAPMISRATPGSRASARSARRSGRHGHQAAPRRRASTGCARRSGGTSARVCREGSAGIAIALVTGDQNAVDQDDADAMRRSGLTHLLSVSGLHIAAVVAFAMLLTLQAARA